GLHRGGAGGHGCDAVHPRGGRLAGAALPDPSAKRRARGPPADQSRQVKAPAAPAGYSGTPLPKKLGIKEGAPVLLFGAPAGFETTLGELPAGARLRRVTRTAGPAAGLTIWF